jgi:acyl-CoA hydrolase
MDMDDPAHPPEGEPLIRAIAMPADANPSGANGYGGGECCQPPLPWSLRNRCR